METLVLIIHILLAIVLIALILLQQGKGAEAGASFGSGASQTVFGGRGSSSFLARITSAVAIILLVTSVSLGIMNARKVKNMSTVGIPETSTQQTKTNTPTPSSSDIPKIQIKKPETSGKTSSDIPIPVKANVKSSGVNSAGVVPKKIQALVSENKKTNESIKTEKSDKGEKTNHDKK